MFAASTLAAASTTAASTTAASTTAASTLAAVSTAADQTAAIDAIVAQPGVIEISQIDGQDISVPLRMLPRQYACVNWHKVAHDNFAGLPYWGLILNGTYRHVVLPQMLDDEFDDSEIRLIRPMSGTVFVPYDDGICNFKIIHAGVIACEWTLDLSHDLYGTNDITMLINGYDVVLRLVNMRNEPGHGFITSVTCKKSTWVGSKRCAWITACKQLGFMSDSAEVATAIAEA
jgi:hypothetical protein